MVTTLHVGLKAKYLKKRTGEIIELPFAPNIAIIKQEKSYTAVYSHNILIKKELYIYMKHRLIYCIAQTLQKCRQIHIRSSKNAPIFMESPSNIAYLHIDSS